VSLVPPPKVGKLQETLHAKAKKALTWLDALADPAYRKRPAYACVRLRRWRTQTFDLRGPLKARFADRYLQETLELLQLQRSSARLS
jgi:hypothetical protein